MYYIYIYMRPIRMDYMYIFVDMYAWMARLDLRLLGWQSDSVRGKDAATVSVCMCELRGLLHLRMHMCFDVCVCMW